jgi:hypothetical protein
MQATSDLGPLKPRTLLTASLGTCWSHESKAPTAARSLAPLAASPRKGASIFLLALLLLGFSPSAPAAADALELLGWNTLEDRSQIPLVPSPERLVIERVRTPEARSTRGFFFNAIDGRIDSPGYLPGEDPDEWPDKPGYSGVRYERTKSLSVFLRPGEESFDYMFLRGDYDRGILLENVPDGIWEPDRSVIPPLWPNDGDQWLINNDSGDDHHRWLPESPISTPRLTFVFEDEEYFNRDGTISDLQLFRLGANVIPESYVETLDLGFDALDPSEPQLDAYMMSSYSGFASNRMLLAGYASSSSMSVEMAAGDFLHIATPVLPEGTAIGAVSLNLKLAVISDGVESGGVENLVHVVVTDVFNPQHEIVSLDVTVDEAGELRLLIDVPDQIVTGVPKTILSLVEEMFVVDDVRTEQRLWVSVVSEHAVTISALPNEAAVQLHLLDEATAQEEYIEHRFNIVRNSFQALSEPRPWNTKDVDIDDTSSVLAAPGSFRPELLLSLRDGLDDLLAVDDTDSRFLEYYDWLRPVEESREGRVLFDFTDCSVAALHCVPHDPTLPRWAELQIRAWQILREYVFWWYEERMISDGQLGSHPTDDGDFAGNVIDLAMFDGAVSRPLVRDALQRLADTVDEFELVDDDGFHRGVGNRRTDPLHFYEKGQNLQGYMPYLSYGDPVALERISATSDSLHRMTDTFDAGLDRSLHRHFVSDENPVKLDPEDIGDVHDAISSSPGYDSIGNILQMHSPMMLAWYRNDPDALQFLDEYVGGWVEHHTRADAFPSIVELGDFGSGIDDTVLDDGWEDRATRGGYGVGNILVSMAWMTGHEEWYEPFRLGFDDGDYAFDWNDSIPDAILRMDVSDWTETGGMATLYEGELDRHTAQFMAWKLAGPAGDKADLERSLRLALDELWRFPWMWTEAEQFTDRLFFPSTSLARAAMGGSSSRNDPYSTRALSFDGFDLSVASLVYVNEPDALRFTLVNVTDDAQTGLFRVWQLERGTYRLVIGPDWDDDGSPDSISRDEIVELERYSPTRIALPPRTPMAVELTQVESLEDSVGRPDLAVSLASAGGRCGEAGISCAVTVHNVGAAAAGPFQVRLLNENLNVLAVHAIAGLAAPSGFFASSEGVVFDSLPMDAIWVDVVSDEDLREITIRNNRVALSGMSFADPDGDLIPSEEDNCPKVSNIRQADRIVGGSGNACVVYCDLNADDRINRADRRLGARLISGEVALVDAHLDRGDVWPPKGGDGAYTAEDLSILNSYLADRDGPAAAHCGRLIPSRGR